MKTVFLQSLAVLVFTSTLASAQYICVCSFQDAKPIYKTASVTSTLIGVLPKNQCIEQVTHFNSQWSEVNYNSQNGFINVNRDPGSIQICVGKATNQQYTTIAKESTRRPQMLFSATPLSHGKTTVSSTSHQPSLPTIIEGHPEMCPKPLQRHTQSKHGFIGQYGNYCYEFVPVPTQYANAQKDCMTAFPGNLTDINDYNEQKYIERFMASHGQSNDIWIGLHGGYNGHLKWNSGKPVDYTHFVPNTLNNGHGSCFVFRSDGYWDRTECGISVPFSFGLGEHHPYICKYSISDSPTSFLSAALNAILGR